MRGTVGLLSFSVVACDHPAADMAAGRCSYAGTIDIVHARAACVADLRDHAVWLMKRRGRHGLRGCCDGQSKCNSDNLMIVTSRVNLPRKTSWRRSVRRLADCVFNIPLTACCYA